MRIVEVAIDSPEFEDFVALPWRIYPGAHRWVPPLKATLRQELSPQNQFFTHGEAQCFVAMEEDRVVGRIVASVDNALADPSVGHFGYFEAIDDRQVTAALIDAAEAWVVARGRTALHGPIDLNIFNNYRLQTAGFERAPFFGEPRAPRYYPGLLEACGLTVLHTWRSWDISGLYFPLMRLVVGWKARRHKKVLDAFKILPFDLVNFEEECRQLHPLVMETFNRNYGFSAITASEFTQRFGGAAAIISPLTSFRGITPDGKTIGYFYTYRDPAQAFQAADGDAERLDLDGAKQSDTLVFHTIGILKEHRKIGLIEAGYPGVMAGIRRSKFKKIIGALAKEGPTVYDMFGAATRRYAVYSRPCGQTR